MKPAYWIGIMALVGAVGALVGTIIYERLREKQG